MDDEFGIEPIHVAFYVEAMIFNTSSALQACERAVNIIEQIEDGKLDVQAQKGDLLDALQNIINHSGAISRFFWPPEATPRKTKSLKNLHKNRADYLKRTFGISESSALSNRALRNAIEHFEERLDLYLSDGIVGHVFPSLILGKPEETEIPHHIFRAYYLETGEFQILGERYAIEPIVDELVALHERLIAF
ncbi:hypothetical protein [Asticcacaulis taihuensis]|uniref:hypothetical protein n=1 Tax=Asticcacaulis taihuensis TaxID=260084 RepID=UPI0026F2A1FB|nr:hypothetical protein [Asticcacaulis taihuensis]